MMKKAIFLVSIFLSSIFYLSSAEISQTAERIALVIGNGDYEGMAKLTNPANDAEDMGETLITLGFDAEVLTDAGLYAMEESVLRFRDKLSQYPDSVGFFFYAGHGVQSGGENYLIPVDARINSEALLRTRAVPLQFVLDSLKEANNNLNIIVLDACRDNPFSWARSSSRGLAVVGQQPPSSIVVYSTSAGRIAQDGTGRNSIFAEELMQHLRTPWIDISEALRRTGEAVQDRTEGAQIPAIYSQFFGFLYLSEEEEAAADEGSDILYLPAFFEEASPEVQIVISQAEENAFAGKRLAGWEILEAHHPSDPIQYSYVLAEKILYALTKSDDTSDYRGFFFSDDSTQEDTDALQEEENKQYFTFDPHSEIQQLGISAEDFPPILSVALGDYYSRVYYAYPLEWKLNKQQVQDLALKWYGVAESHAILVDYSSIVAYTDLLTDTGKTSEAVSLLQKKIELFQSEDLQVESESLWWYLIYILERSGNYDEALKEIDAKIEAGLIEQNTEEAIRFYQKAAQLSIAGKRKEDFNRYLAMLEKQFPDRREGALLRHRYAVSTGDKKSAEQIADRLLKQYPVESLLEAEILEELLDNWLTDPSGFEGGLAFLDHHVKESEGNPSQQFIFYMYRAAYRLQYVQKFADTATMKKMMQESLADLDYAEACYQRLPEQDSEIREILKEFRDKLKNDGK